jgi:hypothetical protein
MFLGHYAVALGAKKAAPATSLGTFILAAQLVDLLWPVFLLLGWERVRIDPGNTAVTPLDFVSYPWTHSLVAMAGWGLALGVAYWLVRRYPRGAVVVAMLVVSHWILDALVHGPDLPITPGGETRVGLGLWDSLPATLALELGLFAAGAWIYSRVTEPVDRVGTWSFRALIAVLALIYAGNLFGGAPPGETEVAVVTLGLWLFVPWGYWIDRHRRVRSAPRPAGGGVSPRRNPPRRAGV